MNFARPTICFLLLSLFISARAQEIDPSILQKFWKASWIMVPGSSPNGYGVFYFRKGFELTSIPQSFLVHVSADNRYKLFINEKLVSIGPARGDVEHWNFETIDLAPFLRQGKNIIAAQVWNEGEQRPEANTSYRTGFILQGAGKEAEALNTNASWKCVQDSSYSPIKISMATYYVAGPGESIDMQKHITGWEKLSFDDSQWPMSKAIRVGAPKNQVGFGDPIGWLLVPSSLPQMELKQQRFASLRKASGITVPASFPAAKTAITIPANTTASLLLDQSFLTNAYTSIIFSAGKNSKISLGYQEALFSKYPAKGNRNEIEGKTLIGRKDNIISNGSEHQEFTTLSWRTYRYLQIDIVTNETPLVLEDVYGTFTGYPFILKASLETDNAELHKMLEIGWRTARLCAVETYMDCPYYEQLQYVGDTRIQALVSIYNSGDIRLVRNALNAIDQSRQPEGITMSRYPTTTAQYIPPFSLWYIGMMHDYMMYASDTIFVKQKLGGIRQIISYFNGFQQTDGSLKNLPWWNFTDWVNVPNWSTGIRSAGKDGNSALMDLQLLWALQLATDMEQRIGMKEYAAIFNRQALLLKKTIQNKYWDNNRKLFADRSEKDLFSQHANALAILTGLVAGSDANKLGKQLLSDTAMAPASIYFKYYLHLALVKAGFGNDYLDWLGKWRENINMGLTTWGETSDVNSTRSDCHAWGASPNIEFFRIVLGIDSDAPGFAKIKIEPHLGNITALGGEMPHPNGKIKVKYQLENAQLTAEIELPSKTSGRFVWKNKSYVLKAGKNTLSM